MANKLITDFTPITTPANTRLLTLGDETTGQRFRISIADFFALVASTAEFKNNGLVLAMNRDTTTGGIFSIKQGGGEILSIRSTNIDPLLSDVVIRASNTSAKRIVFETGNNQVALTLDEFKDATFPNLAGTGTRNVVVDANGKMSAP